MRITGYLFLIVFLTGITSCSNPSSEEGEYLEEEEHLEQMDHTEAEDSIAVKPM